MYDKFGSVYYFRLMYFSVQIWITTLEPALLLIWFNIEKMQKKSISKMLYRYNCERHYQLNHWHSLLSDYWTFVMDIVLSVTLMCLAHDSEYFFDYTNS